MALTSPSIGMGTRSNENFSVLQENNVVVNAVGSEVLALKHENKKGKSKIQKTFLQSESQNISNNNSLFTKPLFSDINNSANVTTTKFSFNTEQVRKKLNYDIYIRVSEP